MRAHEVSGVPVVEGASAVAFDGKLWVVGGNSGGKPLGSVWVYDPAAKSWGRGRDLPAAIGEAGVVTDGKRIYVIGGYTAADEPGITPDVEKVHRAAARASNRTGRPIMAHSRPASRTGLDQMRIFLEEGVPASKVMIAHTGDTDAVSEDEKQELLAYLKRSHGEAEGGPRKITLTRKSVSTLKAGQGKIIYTDIFEAFFVEIKVAFFAALMVAFPVLATQLWRNQHLLTDCLHRTWNDFRTLGCWDFDHLLCFSFKLGGCQHRGVALTRGKRHVFITHWAWQIFAKVVIALLHHGAN